MLRIKTNNLESLRTGARAAFTRRLEIHLRERAPTYFADMANAEVATTVDTIVERAIDRGFTRRDHVRRYALAEVTATGPGETTPPVWFDEIAIPARPSPPLRLSVLEDAVLCRTIETSR